MELFHRKKTVQLFAQDLIVQCLEGSSKDVIAHCSDGDVAFNRFYLGLISPVLFRVLNSCLYNSLPEVSILLPEYTKQEVIKLKKIFSGDEAYPLKSSLVEDLSIMKPGEKPKSTAVSPLGKKTVGNVVPDYYETIPDISNLDSLDLFEPMYIEDVEIQNEDDLSLTIHSSDVDLLVPAQKKPRPRKPRVSPKVKVRRKEERNETAATAKLTIKIPKSCHSCGEKFQTKSLLDKHLKEQCAENTFKCSKCEKIFSSEEQLSVHAEKHARSEERKLICQFCTKAFKRIFQLQNHLRIHSGEKPFICHTCGKAFSQEATLRIHLKIHTGVKPYACGECGESYSTGNSLLSHKQWKHSNSRPFLCSFCSKSFPTKGAVGKHETIHKQEKKHSCNVCDKKFARSDHLKSHMRSHQTSEASL